MKVVIVGGRHEADYIISMYNNKKNDLIVINQDEDVCRYLSAQNNIPVMRGISTRQSDLHLAGAENADLFIALAENDHENYVACKLAKKVFGAKRCIAAVINPKNVDAFRSLGIDSVLSATYLLGEQIRNAASIENLIRTLSLENDEIVMSSEKGHMLDQDEIRLLLNEKKKKELLNLLKFSMESLAAKKLLDAAALNEIRQDLLQTVYVYLHSKEIQATQLFANETAENLERASTESLMNMVRWQVFFISNTIDYVSEVEQSDSIVQRAKNFIHEHYMEEISRTEVAAVVFLTPEYMAKMFKKEEGVSIKQYISDYRIQKAKELLSSPSVRISDVAADVGFDNFSYFSTVFKKTTGYTPGEFHAMTMDQGDGVKGP